METQIKTIKSVIPNLVKQFGDFIQVDVCIKLFGVKVFSFTWPPMSESCNNTDVVFKKDDLPC